MELPTVIVINAADARPWAADIIAQFISEAGVCAFRCRCPHCEFTVQCRHDTEEWLIYECLRCGATYLYQELWISLP